MATANQVGGALLEEFAVLLLTGSGYRHIREEEEDTLSPRASQHFRHLPPRISTNFADFVQPRRTVLFLDFIPASARSKFV